MTICPLCRGMGTYMVWSDVYKMNLPKACWACPGKLVLK